MSGKVDLHVGVPAERTWQVRHRNLRKGQPFETVDYGAIDRSPCGTGTSARMAQLYALGKLPAGRPFVHESIIGSQFVGRVEDETRINDQPAILPSIEGWARITGFNEIIVDDDDPFAHGFTVT